MTSHNLPIRSSSAPGPTDDATPDPQELLSHAFTNGGGANPSDRIDWRRMLQALGRFKWLLLAAVLLGTGAGAWATRLIDPQYAVSAMLWIDLPSARQSGRERGPLRSGQLLEPSTWVDLLESYVVLEHVVNEMRLYLRPGDPGDRTALRTFGASESFRPGRYRFAAGDDGTFVLSTHDGVELDRGKLGDSVGVRLGFRWAPRSGDVAPGRSVEFELLTSRDAARGLAENLTTRMDPEGSFLRVELEGPSPRHITRIVNAVIERYVTVAAQLKKEKLTGLTLILDDQLQVARRTLDSAETALQRFRVANITRPSDRAVGSAGETEARDPVVASFFDQQIERDAVSRDRELLERWLSRPPETRVGSTIEVLPAVQASADLKAALKELSEKQIELRSLKTRYADDYPPVQRLTADNTALQNDVIPKLATSLVEGLRAREAALGRQLAAAGGTLRQIPARTLEEGRLRRAVTLAENLYTTLQQRYDENRIEEASSIPDVRVVDAAVSPARPVKNTAPRIILLAFVASLALAATGAVAYDRMDPKVRYPEQVSRELGLTILGVVPHIASSSRGYRLTAAQGNEVLEALRGVCLSMVYAHGGSGPLLVTITSPGAGDGKSFLSANLALTFSDGGHRTLLIDADLRRGLQHRRFGSQRRPGLSDYLRGEVPGEAVVEATAYPSLSFLPCGSRTHSAPELLGSPAMNELLQGFRSRYDVVIVDSPPLTGGVDPFILGALTGNMAIVLRTGFSNRDIAAAKLDVMARLPVRLLGAVLNDVPQGGMYRYYSYYLPGYEGVEEAGSARRPDVL